MNVKKALAKKERPALNEAAKILLIEQLVPNLFSESTKLTT